MYLLWSIKFELRDLTINTCLNSLKSALKCTVLLRTNKSKSLGSMLAFNSLNPFGYGRVVTKNGYVKDVIEEKPDEEEVKKIANKNSRKRTKG